MHLNKKVKLIAAISSNGVIGTSSGKIPWQGLVHSDVVRFINLTSEPGSNSVIMGRKTWDSIPEKFRPLPNRQNIVVTGNKDLIIQSPSVLVVHSIEEAVEKASAKTVWIAGGRQIYEQAFRYVDELHITKVQGEFIGDVTFPYEAWDKSEWVFIGHGDKDDQPEDPLDRIYSRYIIFHRK